MHGMEEVERGQARPKRTYGSRTLQSGQDYSMCEGGRGPEEVEEHTGSCFLL